MKVIRIVTFINLLTISSDIHKLILLKKGEMEFVPYEQFTDIEFISEGGFSKIYRATLD